MRHGRLQNAAQFPVALVAAGLLGLLAGCAAEPPPQQRGPDLVEVDGSHVTATWYAEEDR